MKHKMVMTVCMLACMGMLSACGKSDAAKPATEAMAVMENKDAGTTQSSNTYMPGVYTTSLMLNDNVVDIEVTVDESSIIDIRTVNLNDAVIAMYPLIESAFEDLATQICEKQTTDGVTYPDESKYTSMVLLDAIKTSLQKAEAAAGNHH